MIDLHMHSFYSDDGEFSPAALVTMAAKKGVTCLSVTDHNCARANAEAAQAAKACGIRYLPGIEIDCTFQGLSFHLLGYGIDWECGDFAAIEEAVARQNHAASLQRLEKTRALGFSEIREKDLESLSGGGYWKGSWTGEMFAEVLLSMPQYATHPLLAPYRPGGSRSDNPYVNFYWDFYAQGKACYGEMRYPSMAEILETIHRNGGIGVLAHPGVNLKGHESLLDGLIGLGLDGIEAFSSYHRLQQADYFCQKAREHDLLVTCGSDYHGKTKPAIAMGQHGCPIAPEKMISSLGFLLRE